MKIKALLHPNITLPIAIVLGVFGGMWSPAWLRLSATHISEMFINLLRLVSLPIVFLSIVSTASSMGSIGEVKEMGGRVLKYTLLTTMIAASVALGLFLLINPVRTPVVSTDAHIVGTDGSGYFGYLLKAIPSNVITPFAENNVIGVLILAALLSLAILSLPEKNQSPLHILFSSLLAAVMKVTSWIIKAMPIAIFSFVVLFIHDLKGGLEVESIALFLLCVVAANLVQALVVLPTLLKIKGLSPVWLFKSMFQALSVAFFTKSSGATLPMAVKCAEEKAGISSKVCGFSLPLCISINMNGCAAFILTTVLFVSMSNGIVFSLPEMFGWIFIATLAALGNAGVPMGCYFLSSAFLAAMGVPLNILGVILPFYTLIDMLETAINVWSDSCVTAIVDKEVQESERVRVGIHPHTSPQTSS
jgi:Na+/H+-dicarboxylate symporter